MSLKKRLSNIRPPSKKNSHTTPIITCPNCQHIISLDDPESSSFTLNCPLCEYPLIYHTEKNTSFKQHPRKYLSTIVSDHFVELILFTLGLIFLFQPTPENLKISFTLIFIASILTFLMTGEYNENNSEKLPSTAKPYYKRPLHPSAFLKKLKNVYQRIKDVPLSNRISIVLILWTLLLYVITADLEIYFILIFIGVLITRELTDLYTSNMYKKRLNAYIVIFLFTYIVLITQKIIEILST